MKKYTKHDEQIFVFEDGSSNSLPNEIEYGGMVLILPKDTDTDNTYINRYGELVEKTLDELHIEERILSTHFETLWQEDQLNKVTQTLKECEADLKIPERYSELRVTTFTERDYYQLLMDRKLLIEYLNQPDFPECGRPQLSNLITD